MGRLTQLLKTFNKQPQHGDLSPIRRLKQYALKTARRGNYIDAALLLYWLMEHYGEVLELGPVTLHNQYPLDDKGDDLEKQFAIGLCYLFGLGVDRNEMTQKQCNVQAYQQLCKVAESKYVPAVVWVALCQEMAIGTPVDTITARNTCRQYMEESAIATTLLSSASLEQSNSIPKKVLQSVIKFADENNTTAQMGHAQYLMTMGPTAFDKIRERFEQAATIGNRNGQHDFAVYMEKEKFGFKKDPERVKYLYKQASEQGMAESSFNLTIHYYHEGLKQKSARYIAIACRQFRDRGDNKKCDKHYGDSRFDKPDAIFWKLLLNEKTFNGKAIFDHIAKTDYPSALAQEIFQQLIEEIRQSELRLTTIDNNNRFIECLVQKLDFTNCVSNENKILSRKRQVIIVFLLIAREIRHKGKLSSTIYQTHINCTKAFDYQLLLDNHNQLFNDVVGSMLEMISKKASDAPVWSTYQPYVMLTCILMRIPSTMLAQYLSADNRCAISTLLCDNPKYVASAIRQRSGEEKSDSTAVLCVNAMHASFITDMNSIKLNSASWIALPRDERTAHASVQVTKLQQNTMELTRLLQIERNKGVVAAQILTASTVSLLKNSANLFDSVIPKSILNTLLRNQAIANLHGIILILRTCDSQKDKLTRAVDQLITFTGEKQKKNENKYVTQLRCKFQPIVRQLQASRSFIASNLMTKEIQAKIVAQLSLHNTPTRTTEEKNRGHIANRPLKYR